MSDRPDEPNRVESFALTLLFALIALGLLAAIGLATRTGQATAGWWTRPAMMPGVALAILLAANAISLWRAGRELRALPPSAEEWRAARAAFAGWLRPLEFLAYFAAYLWALHWIGYFPATLVFVAGLMVRKRLTTPRWLLAGLALAVALVLIFRVGLGVWMPAPPLYDLAPEALRSTLIRWF